MQRHFDLSAEELERLAAFTFGLVLGLVLVAIVGGLIEEWIIAGELADRRRIRELVREELARRTAAATPARWRSAAELPPHRELPGADPREDPPGELPAAAGA